MVGYKEASRGDAARHSSPGPQAPASAKRARPHPRRNAATGPGCAQGRYSFKLLAVDVPSAVGGEQRIFLQGDEAIYSRGGVLAELREPFTRVRVSPRQGAGLRRAV